MYSALTTILPISRKGRISALGNKNGLISQYDTACKEMLSHKMILAHIMKDCMPEYAGVEANVIARRSIETEPLVSQVLNERSMI